MSVSKKESVLVDRLIKYAGDDEEACEFVKKEVKAWVKKMEGKGAKVTQSDLKLLDDKIERGCKAIKERQAEKAKGPSHHDVVLANERNSSKAQEDGDESIPVNYVTYGAVHNKMYLQEQAQKRRNLAAKKRELKEQLDQQIAENAGKNDYVTKIESDYANECRRNYAAYIEAQKKQKEIEAAKMEKLQSDRAKQLAEINRRRAKEHARNKAEENAMLDLAAAAVKAEEERRKQNIREQKAFMERVIAENEENKRLIALRKIQLQEEAIELQREAVRRLEEQERRRKETFDRMKAKSANNQQMFLEATAEATAKQKEDEDRMIRFQEEKVKADQEALRQELIAREQEKVKLRNALAEQVATKKKREHDERVARGEFTELYRAEAQAAIEQTKKEAARRRQQAIENRIELQKQIEEKQQRVDETSNSVMTDVEVKLNKSKIISLVKDDKEMIAAIQAKLDQAKKVDEMKMRRKMGIRGGKADIQDDDDEYF